MNPTLVKVVRPEGTAPLPDETEIFTNHLLGSHEPPFRMSRNASGTAYVRVVHDSNTLESLLDRAAPLVTASAIVLSLNGRRWKPPAADAGPEVSSDLRDPGSASTTLGATSDLPLPRTPTPASKSPDDGSVRTVVIPSKPRDDDPPLPHEQRIRSVFPGTGGDDGFSPRPQQVQALSHIIQAIEGGSTDIFLQMPTGGGKSVIGHALSKLVSASPTYYTVDKVALGDQYSRSLPVVHRIAGRRNYACHLEIEPSQVSRSTAEVAEALARERAVQADQDGDPDPFIGLRRRPVLTADKAPCRTVRVSTKDGDRGFPCSFSRVPAELNDWTCPDCGSEEILHRCSTVGRWVDIGDHWDSIGSLLGSTRMCPYYRDRFIASNSSSVITTNDYYFRYPQFTKRPLAVYDECDRLPQAVLRNLTIDITTRSVARMIDVSVQSFMGARKKKPANTTGQRTLFGENVASDDPNLYDLPEDLADFDPDHHLDDPSAWELDSGRIVSWLQRLLSRVRTLMDRDAYEPSARARVETQVASIRPFLDRIAAPDGELATEPNYYWEAGTREDGIRWISLKPILIGEYARATLESRSRIRLYMSATVGDVDGLVRELGLDPASTTYIRFDYSDFPVANRPVVAVRGGTMSYKRGEGRQPDDFLAHAKIIHGIATRMYPDRKGMILPFSNPISDGLNDAIRRRYSSVATRLIRDSADMGSDRYAFIERFREGTGNRILMSTYTNEGFDPIPTDKDPDRSIHWLVVAKIPYPDLKDMRVRILRTRHPETYGDAWYEAETARTWLQMIGRIHRSAGDTGRVFVLDPAFTWAYKKWRHAGLIPQYIDEAVDLRD